MAKEIKGITPFDVQPDLFGPLAVIFCSSLVGAGFVTLMLYIQEKKKLYPKGFPPGAHTQSHFFGEVDKKLSVKERVKAFMGTSVFDPELGLKERVRILFGMSSLK